jgi:hypothetical protein
LDSICPFGDTRKQLESLILAQNERWRRALHMQVERGRVAIPESSGARVSNAWMTCLRVGDNPGKLGLIPHKTERSKGAARLSPAEGSASD